MADKKLVNPELLKEFDVVGKLPALKFTERGFGFIDMTTLTVKEAAKLVEAKFPWLKKKGKPAKAAEVAETEKE